MAWHLRFRRSVKIAPGVRLNFNKASHSVTVGRRGVHYTHSTNGTVTKSFGIPGTGVSWRKTSSKEGKR